MAESASTQIVVAGAVAAFTVDLLIYPLDTIKTRRQGTAAIGANGAAGTASRAGLRSLYQGVGSVILVTLPAGMYLLSLPLASVFFLSYETCKRTLGELAPATVPEPAVHAVASAIAELASCTVLAPAEVIKQNAQMLSTSSSSSLSALRRVWGQQGDTRSPARRLWTGYSALAGRNLPFTALQFPIFEFLKARVWRRKATRETGGDQLAAPGARGLLHTGLVTGGSAAAAGAIAAWVTTPLDMLKTRMMLSAGSQVGGGGEHGSEGQGQRTRASGRNMAMQIWKRGGIAAFFRGGSLRVLWTAVGSGLYLGSYEATKAWLRQGERQTE